MTTETDAQAITVNIRTDEGHDMDERSIRPTKSECELLTRQVDLLILPQANIFLRELLRDLGLTPQPNKDASRVQFINAIEEGVLTQDTIESWLRKVEGWGNQHVYVFRLPDELAGREVWTETALSEMTTDAFEGTWRAVSRSLDTESTIPLLSRIDFDDRDGVFMVEWHERTDSRLRAPDMDDWPKKLLPEYAHPGSLESKSSDLMKNAMLIANDTYWFDAFRLQPARSIMRFAVLIQPRVIDRPIAALFLRTAFASQAHAKFVELAWRDLSLLSLNGIQLSHIRQSPWNISTIIKRLDTAIAFGRGGDMKSRKTRFSEELAAVEFVAPPNLQLPKIIRDVRLSIPKHAIDNGSFIGSMGDFHKEADPQRATSRRARLELFQDKNRIRIWTELDEADVWTILETLEGYS